MALEFVLDEFLVVLYAFYIKYRDESLKRGSCAMFLDLELYIDVFNVFLGSNNLMILSSKR